MQCFCDPGFYSDLVKTMHDCAHKRFVQSKKNSKYAKEVFPYQQALKKDGEGVPMTHLGGVPMTHLVVIVKYGERNKWPDFGNNCIAAMIHSPVN